MSEIEEYQSLTGRKINLRGFSSFTTDESVANQFLIQNWKQGNYPVLFELDVGAANNNEESDQSRPWKFRLNSAKYTMYPDENEVLLDDGTPFIV